MIHAKDMKNFKGEKKGGRKTGNLMQNTMQEKTKYYGNRIWRDMSSLGKWLILAVVTWLYCRCCEQFVFLCSENRDQCPRRALMDLLSASGVRSDHRIFVSEIRKR